MGPSQERPGRPVAGKQGFWDPVKSNVVDCFVQFFDYVLPREPLAVVRVVAHCLYERLAWCDPEGGPRAPREIVSLADLDEHVALDRKSIRRAIARCVERHYLEPVVQPPEQGGGAGLRLKLDLRRFTLDESEFEGFYPLPTHRVRVPVEFFTQVVPGDTLSTIKVVACIIRLTLGSIDNLGRSDVMPAISQQQFVRRMNMGRRQAIEGVHAALLRGYIRRLEQGSLETGRPSTYSLFWRSADQALAWPSAQPKRAEVVALDVVMGKGDQDVGRKGSGGAENGITPHGKRDQAARTKGSGGAENGITGSGKGDQAARQKGSGPARPYDLLKDLDLDLLTPDSRSSSSVPTRVVREPAADPGAAAAAALNASLFERVRRRFPCGNRQLVEQFVGARGSFVGEVLDALEDVDPAFLRRFTRTTDPAWAAFHTCCQQGILPPRRPVSPPLLPVALAVDMRREEEEEDDWRQLSLEAQAGSLVELWAATLGLYQIATDATERAEFEALVRDRLDEGGDREALERWVFEDVARRRGRAIGPIAGR